MVSQRPLAATAGAVLIGLICVACDIRVNEASKRIAPEYDKATGKLILLKYDSNGNGVVDTWSYMDGTRIVRIEIDQDENGTIDRWEYYSPDSKLEKIGFSRSNDGRQDAWSHPGPDGTIERIESSTRRDGKISRIEHYSKGLLVSAEEDSDGDGRMDKWETYAGDRLAWVAFDMTHRGTPDRRLIYNADGSVRVEVDTAGNGRFVGVNDKGTPANPR